MITTSAGENEFQSGAFKSYDVRGHFGTEITPALAHQIGRAFSKVLQARVIAVGHDMREHSPILEDSLVEGLTAAGTDVIRIGQCSTPMSYFAAATLNVDGAVMVTASHNPGHDNGFKFSKREGEPMGEGTGLEKVKELVLSGKSKQISGEKKGSVSSIDLLGKWCAFLKPLLPNVRPLRIVIDCGSGVMGPIIRKLLAEVDPTGKVQATWLFDKPDWRFPGHPADPLKLVNVQHLQGAVIATKADFGVAFDGDGDRLAFVEGSEYARFVGCDLITALFAKKLLSLPANRGKNVMYDLRSSAVVGEVIRAAGGVPELSRVGHSHIKAAMRGKRAGTVLDPNVQGEIIFAGEISGHFFFRDCFCFDSSERAFLLALQILTEENRTLEELVAPLRKYWQSGELNYRLPGEDKKKQLMQELEEYFSQYKIFKLDGISGKTNECQFNVRFSNTEPLVRVAAESFVSEQNLKDLLGKLEGMIVKLGGAKLGK